MIFDVAPSQIEALDQKELVMLLRRLLHAEAQRAGINLRGVSVPLQITVADGGEDARIRWEGGAPETDYIPGRFTVFQSKASDPGPAGWKKETWTKASQKKGHKRKLNTVLTNALKEGGSYLGFTSASLVDAMVSDRVNAIRSGIVEAKGDPTHLHTLDLYDANKIAAWCSRHPSVAIWLNEHQSGLALGGFQTVDGFGRQADFSLIAHVADTAKRYVVNDVQQGSTESGARRDGNTLTFDQARERISDHLLQPKNIVRLVGPSGIGKTRFTYELLKDISTVAKESRSISAIFCDYRSVGPSVLQLAQTIADKGSPTLLVVDECSRETAQQLSGIVSTECSLLRLLTIDIDDRPIPTENCLNIAINPSDASLVEGIIRQRLPNANGSEISYISNLCGGFPKLAVLATESYAKNAPILKSIEDVVERILAGAGIRDEAQIRAIEGLSLFSRLGADDDLSDEFDLVAERLCLLSGDEMYEYIARAASHHIVDKRGRFFVTQPLPIASFLGARRLGRLRIRSIVDFVSRAHPLTQSALFAQWRYFDSSRTAVEVTQRLLVPTGLFGSFEALSSQHGSECLDALVHVAPDVVADTLKRVLGELSVDELSRISDGRRHIVWALEKLVFRDQSFHTAARLLMRFGARETEKFSNNAASTFKQLFQLELSGTEASPADRFAVLDEGLATEDPRIVDLCMESLEETLTRSHFARSGESEQIGTRPPLRDWHAKAWGEVFDFHREGLRRLLSLRSKDDNTARRCERAIANNLRELICENLIDEIEQVVRSIARDRGLWLEAIESIGDWLYYDRAGSPEGLSKRVRALYDFLFPTDLVERALLYTKFWSADIHDPDQAYSEDTSTRDFEYSTNKAVELAEQIASDLEATQRAIRTMAGEQLHNAFPFARSLGMHVSDPISTFRLAVETFENSVGGGMQFVRGLLSGIDAKSKPIGDQCVEIALRSEAIKKQAINIYTSVGLTHDRLEDVRRSLRDGTLAPRDCSYLSYGRGLDDLAPVAFIPLLNDLTHEHGADGAWTALEIISMYQHGRASFDDSLKEMTKDILVSPTLIEKVGRDSRNGYLFETMIALLERHAGVDDAFLTGIGDQIAKLCRSSDSSAIFVLDGPIRKALKSLLSRNSTVLWLSISRFYEFATETERFWLKHLIGPSDHMFDGESHNKEGILFAVPRDQLLDWVRLSPRRRVSFLCEFYPILQKGPDDVTQWHEALQSLASEFGGEEEFRDALAERLCPRSWSGSIIPHIEIYMEPLKSWFEHPISQLATWARERYRLLEKRIAGERARDEED